jgi:4-hydroxybenzoate polyprenyltransferase
VSDSTRLEGNAASLRAWAVALRPAHWIKNLLVVAPVIFAHEELTIGLAFDLAISFVVCSLVASAGYLINDVLDLAADRQHVSKRLRPIAAGLIDERQAGVVAAVLALMGLVLALAVFGPYMTALVAAYLLLTAVYSRWLKRLPVVDVLALAVLFSWRLLVGGIASDIVVSGWLLAFGYCLFVALALAKRVDEAAVSDASHLGPLPQRPYRHSSMGLLRLGAFLCAGVALATLAAYVALSAAAEEFYRHEVWLWVSAALLGIWLVHILRRAAAGRLRGDPVVFAASDPMSLILAATVAASLIAAV